MGRAVTREKSEALDDRTGLASKQLGTCYGRGSRVNAGTSCTAGADESTEEKTGGEENL